MTELYGHRARRDRRVFSVELDGPSARPAQLREPTARSRSAASIRAPTPSRVTSAAGNGEAQVQVVDGQPASVDITLASNAVVIGKVVDPAGKPLAGLGIAVVPDSPDGHLRI